MKRFLTCFLFLFALIVSFVAMAEIVEPTISTKESKWWMERYNKMQYAWTDHRGREHTLIAYTTNDVLKASVSDVSITFTSNLVWQTYKVTGGHLNDDYSYDLARIAPGTYTNGLFYTQMTDAQKTELWVAYTNQVIQAQLAHLEEKYADAKFDVSMDPEEYKELLMQRRTEDNLLPEEKMAIRSEYNKYYDEWLRINDPEKWDWRLGLPSDNAIISEQTKKKSHVRSDEFARRREAIQRARAKKAAESSTK